MRALYDWLDSKESPYHNFKTVAGKITELDRSIDHQIFIIFPS